MGLKICLGIFFVLFLFLLIPIRYRFILEIKHLAVTVEFIFGLYKKTMELPGKKRERTADADEKIEELLFADEERPAAAQRAEMILADETEPEKAPEEKTKENKAEKQKKLAEEGKGEKKKHPPLWKQLRFAVHNGTQHAAEMEFLRRVRYGGSDADRPACGDGKGVSSGSCEKCSVEIYRAIV